MTDVVVTVMVYPPTPNGDADSQRRFYRRGDIVTVMPAEKLVGRPNMTIRANGTGPGRMRYIRVTGIPAPFEKIKNKMCERIDHETDLVAVGRNHWKGDPIDMLSRHPALYTQLRDEGVITLTWEQVKRVLKRPNGVGISDADVG
jgi:hypothetical protein